MKSWSARLRLALLIVAVCGIVLFVCVEYGGMQQLQAVTLDEQPLTDWGRLALNPGKPMLRQPVARVAEQLLCDTATVKVDISYELPASMHITTNRIAPTCYVVDKLSGRILGLDDQARAIPLRAVDQTWELPVLTGVKTRGWFETCADARVSLVVPHLIRLADDNADLYRLIDEVDFSSDSLLTVTMSGLPYQLSVTADAFYRQVTDFVKFAEDFHPRVDSVARFDLRFDEMIIGVARSDDSCLTKE
jgi:hypothetical protein